MRIEGEKRLYNYEALVYLEERANSLQHRLGFEHMAEPEKDNEENWKLLSVYRTAIRVMKKQEFESTGVPINKNHPLPFCPICTCPLRNEYGRNNYCSQCGVKIDWVDSEERL